MSRSGAVAASLLKQNPDKGSIKTKRLRAGWDDDFRLRVLDAFALFASLTRKLAHSERCTTREQPWASIFAYAEAFSYCVWRHSSPGFVSPEEFERTYHP